MTKEYALMTNSCVKLEFDESDTKTIDLKSKEKSSEEYFTR